MLFTHPPTGGFFYASKKVITMTEKHSWILDIVGSDADCSPGVCGACCVLPRIENPETDFYKTEYTPCPHLDRGKLLCTEWPAPPCGKKDWTCRVNINEYPDAHMYRTELIRQRHDNLAHRLRLKRQALQNKHLPNSSQ